MRIATSCITCAMERDSLEKGEVLFADLNDDDILVARCPKGHEVRFVLQQLRFEVLMEMGAMALLDGYYRKAVSSFAAAVERFMEFYIRAACGGRGVATEALTNTWKLMSSQSERQLGAFMALYLLEEGAAPSLDAKMTEFRNAVIHKGRFPSRSEAYRYGEWAFSFMVEAGAKLRSRHEDASFRVVAGTIGPAFDKLRARGEQTALQYTSMFLSWADSSWASATFDRAMRLLKDRRADTWAPPDEA
jgi:Arc/MetJ-type ribon-helix-helix transcriptional regulator